MRQVLLIEDSRDIAELLALHLQDLGCRIDWAPDGAAGLQMAGSLAYDLVILDLLLPGIDGLEVCRQLRNGAAYVPILMLTARSGEVDRVVGLELGADDYLTKPFSIRELLARVKALFRRVEALAANSKPAASGPVRAGDIALDMERRSVVVAGKPVELTAKEFDLLAEFVRNPGVVYSRSMLLDRVWGYRHLGYEHTVNSHINRLRAKIERDPRRPVYLVTVWGVGYKLAEALPP